MGFVSMQCSAVGCALLLRFSLADYTCHSVAAVASLNLEVLLECIAT